MTSSIFSACTGIGEVKVLDEFQAFFESGEKREFASEWIFAKE